MAAKAEASWLAAEGQPEVRFGLASSPLHGYAAGAATQRCAATGRYEIAAASERSRC